MTFSDIIFSDSINIRLKIWDSLQNTIHRYVEMIGFKYILESMGLIIADPQLRPTDTLLRPPPTMHSASSLGFLPILLFYHRRSLQYWRKLICSEVRAFRSRGSPLGIRILVQVAMESLSMATNYIERKYDRNDIGEYYIGGGDDF